MYQRLFPDGSRNAPWPSTRSGRAGAAGRLAEAVPRYEAALEMDRKHLPAGHKDLLAPS